MRALSLSLAALLLAGTGLFAAGFGARAGVGNDVQTGAPNSGSRLCWRGATPRTCHVPRAACPGAGACASAPRAATMPALGTCTCTGHGHGAHGTGAALSPSTQVPLGIAHGLTAIEGIKVGHHTLTARPTGCTVVLIEGGATAGVHLPGAAPAARDTALLDPADLVQHVQAIALSGGSAFGLETAAGVMRFLEERGIGFAFGGSRVPIVPGASIFDLPVGTDPKIRPDAGCGYQAAQSATSGPIAEGSVGAGAGATVGKFAGRERGMKGGIGTASITMASGLTVAALVVVNAAGDVVDPASGRVVAGVRTKDGRGLADVRTLLRSSDFVPPRVGENTTLAVVATNATLSKAEATALARMASAGLARAIVPAYTTADGDTVFALATGARTGNVNLSLIGALAAEAVSDAILRAVREATSVAGYPAVRDLPIRGRN